jgi:hypothetical protein
VRYWTMVDVGVVAAIWLSLFLYALIRDRR